MTTTSLWLPGMAASAMQAGQAPMQTGYALATSLLSDVMRNEAPDQLATYQAMIVSETPSILVVDGQYDHIHHVLEASSIPHARLASRDLIGAALKELPTVDTVLINCGGNLSEDSARVVASFIEAGGRLLTTDWGVKEVIERAFPGTIRHNGRKTQGNVFVEVEFGDPRRKQLPAAPDASQRVMVKLAEAAPVMPRWWLEPKSYPFDRVADGVEILIYSKQLKAAYERGGVMVRFQHGAGMVYHMVSHAFLQQKAPGGWARAGANPAGAKSTMLFTTSLGASPETVAAYTEAETADENFDAAAASNTSLSAAALLLPILETTRSNAPK